MTTTIRFRMTSFAECELMYDDPGWKECPIRDSRVTSRAVGRGLRCATIYTMPLDVARRVLRDIEESPALSGSFGGDGASIRSLKSHAKRLRAAIEEVEA